MRAVSWSAMLFLGFFTGVAAAAPSTYSYKIDCEKKLNVDDNWDPNGSIKPEASNNELHINFKNTAMERTATTGSDGEWKVESRCKGSVSLKDGGKGFKIRDFAFRVEKDEIGDDAGRIELYLKGSSNNVANGQKDDFDKSWKVDLTNENKSPYAAKSESGSLCSTDMKIQFGDLRAVVIRKQGNGDREPTTLELTDLVIRFDPC